MYLFPLLAAAATAVSAVAESVTVCVPGQCLQGQSNITRVGAVLDSTSTFILLPGQYTAPLQPAALAQAFQSATATVSLVNGFSNSTSPVPATLPLNVALQPGLLSYPADLFTGDPVYIPLPGSNSSFTATSVNRGSLLISSNTWVAIEASNGGSKSRTVIWDTVPYISQLPPAMAGSLQLVDVQSASCTPACSTGSICGVDGKCKCPPGFTGDSCESCASGFFGPSCKPCPADCATCDQGINGSGVCLQAALPASAPSKCNCGNGVCSGSTCTCTTGWATASNGTLCGACATGFFLNSNGNCEACSAGCQRCTDGNGICTQCTTGLSQDANDRTKCVNPLAGQCPTGSYVSGTTCAACNSACATCKGPGPGDCVTCATQTFFLGGNCVPTGGSLLGVCTGSTLVANQVKGVCDSCPKGCQECQYKTFTPVTKIDDVVCTKCLPGTFLNGGQCVEKCPDGSFANSDGTCSPCSSSCGTCAGSADVCLTCKNNQLASNGSCRSSCDTNFFSQNGRCFPCHPDCATCTGGGFNQCSSCSSKLPVLTSNKRCVATCSKTEYFDQGSGSCKSCDPSCATCSAGGSSGCLSCPGTRSVLRAGACVPNVDCGDGSGTAANLGVCLAELVQSNTGIPNSIPPLDPNAQQNAGQHKKLEWWQILLIVLGAVLLIVAILLIWRWRARKKRAAQTENFKSNLKKRGLWARLWRNPFAAWLARRRSRRVTAHDLEQRGIKGDATPSTPWSPGYTISSSSDRRTAIDVPKSISRGSWVTMGQHMQRRPSLDGRSAVTGYTHNQAGVGAARTIPEERLIDDRDSYRTREERYDTRGHHGSSDSYSDHSTRRYDDRDHGRGESRYYGQEIDQGDERSERTYDLFSLVRSPSRSSYGRGGGVASTKKSYSEGDRYDDSRYNYSRGPSRHDYRDREYDRYRYPESSHRSRRTRRRDYPDDISLSRTDTPSIYSSVTGNRRHLPDTREQTREFPSSRFSVSTVAPSVHQGFFSRKQPRKQPPPVPEIQKIPEQQEAPRQLTDAEMYKMSKLFPELLSLKSPAKPNNNSAPAIVVQDRNPFRQNSY